MGRMIKVVIAKFRELGPLRLVGAVYRLAFNSILQSIYRFDPWHVHGNYFSRPYKARVVTLANSCRPGAAVEIGVGLGDIIGRVAAQRRIGLDIDRRVIAAARHCVPRNVRLAQADFLDPESVVAALKSIEQSGKPIGTLDCLILVNWIHMIDIDDIAESISRIAESYPVRHLVVDAIKPDLSGYRHHHDHAAFQRLGRIGKIIAGDAARELILIERDPLG